MASQRARNPRPDKGGRKSGRADAPKSKQRWSAEERRAHQQSAQVRDAVRVSRISRGRKRDLADVADDRASVRGSRDARPSMRDREERLARDLGTDARRAPRDGARRTSWDDAKRGAGRKPSRYDRAERRPFRDGQDFRDERPRSDERAHDRRTRFERDERRPRWEDRGERGDRFERRDRDERPRRFEREERRPRWEDRGERGDRFERRDRDERPRRFQRDDRRGFDAEPSFKDEMEWRESEAAVGGSATGAFAELGVPGELVAALDARGITEPFPIQAATIPDALGGRDVLGRGQTGSGKTVAFGIPMLARLMAATGELRPRAVVLVPTRELALQVADALSPLAAAAGLSLCLVAGGMSYEPQLKAFRRGVDVIVATPGRLIDHLESENVDLGAVEVAVLDEADLMADMGFTPAVRQILDATAPDGQRLLFSATLDEAVDHLVSHYLHDPVVHEVDPDSAAVSTMAHHVFHVHGADKHVVAAQVANREGRTIVFVRTQKGADRVAGEFLEQGVLAAALHGGLTQGQRARVLAAFRAGTIPVLVATDVAARGIHVDDVSLVMQLDPPADSKDYLHRAGRTARAGADGQVVTIVQPRQRKTVDRLLREAGVETTPRRLRPRDEEQIEELTGGRVPSGEAIDPARVAELTAPQQGPGKGKGKGGKRGWRQRGDRDKKHHGGKSRDRHA